MTGQMDDAVLAWMTRTAQSNLWRVRNYCELDDLLQDGAICWIRVVRFYPGTTMAHRFGLFQTTYMRHLHDLARRSSRRRFVFAADVATARGTSEISVYDAALGVDEERATLYTKLQQAPEVVRAFVSTVLTDEGCAQWRQPYRVRAGRRHETRSQRWARLAGAGGEYNLPKLLREALI